ncbi:hypothetical protein K505DRAFT_335509 [Melanomma pulvis-pyrius CBS 109.77]|uniref:Uncharacterized protein n=1 Tax=Melanomma pulvis-pyrius CBS 109.77 TaxID=1314802 RepID=A0A6A6XKD0_9PLEO|nr:hypothetical protein K505DRAFT_335509 [Melanomma pulvis-pyrius CBS 109.77]
MPYENGLPYQQDNTKMSNNTFTSPFDLDSLNSLIGYPDYRAPPVPSHRQSTSLPRNKSPLVSAARPRPKFGLTSMYPVSGSDHSIPRPQSHVKLQPQAAVPPMTPPPTSMHSLPVTPPPSASHNKTSEEKNSHYPSQHTRDIAAWQRHFALQLQSAIYDPEMHKRNQDELEAAAMLLVVSRPFGTEAQEAEEKLMQPALWGQETLRWAVDFVLAQMGKGNSAAQGGI